MEFYFLFECHGEKINHKEQKEDTKGKIKILVNLVNLCDLCN